MGGWVDDERMVLRISIKSSDHGETAKGSNGIICVSSRADEERGVADATLSVGFC